ncbi:MAG: Ni/Fe hydrogenase subunit alpha [Candidatus Solibacter sp.]|nr:Ni/Fe hydrogenase subunit alpha [Candidatus Solibacter sp.]
MTIKVDCLARVEGEGALHVKVKSGKLQHVQVRIYEPPRLFEAFLRGRMAPEAVDITARICGICPIAYQMSAAHAIERAWGVTIDPRVRALRRLFYCGEWIESHALHVFCLHAPDFLGCQDVIEMAATHKPEVEMALRLKKLGNEIVRVLGGREIHPISACVGGFHKVPSNEELEPLVSELEWGLQAAEAGAKLVATFGFPEFNPDYEFVSLCHPEEYPLNEGRIVSSKGIDIDVGEFEDVFLEQHVKHSNALHSVVRERGSYQVGPVARYNLNFEKLPDTVKMLARELHAEPPLANPFKSILVRSLELMFACEEALRIIAEYAPPSEPHTEVEPKAGRGMAATEAPRGTLYHRYETDAGGRIESAKIVPPTSQNLKRIEDDLWEFLPGILHLPVDDITWRAEQAIRNYDPCISCATHYLRVYLDSE